nr:interference hedgehog-like [Cherax quadricarinatus]
MVRWCPRGGPAITTILNITPALHSYIILKGNTIMCGRWMASPTPLPSLLTLLLLLLLLDVTTIGAEFGIGFTRWPESVVAAVPGTQVRLPCATNVTAEKISWQYNHHFLLADTPSDVPAAAAAAHLQRAPPFEVHETKNGSELVVNLERREGQYRHQLGLYQCVAWFGAIALTSLPGRLVAATLESYPAGSAAREMQEVLEGGAARVECGAPTSVPEAVISFYKDGVLLNATAISGYRLTPHGDLLVHGVGAWAAGEYTCSAHNHVLRQSAAPAAHTVVRVVARTQLTPASPPQFVTLRTIYTAHTGSNVTLLCLANGHPKPTLQWSRYGGRLPLRSIQQEDGSLLITQLAAQDEGTYLCRAYNGLGTEILLDVPLEVLEAPSITLAPESQDVEEGKSVTLACTAVGYPHPKIMWVFNGGLVRNDGNILITENGLTIGVVEKEHAGIFQCFAHNPEGTVQSVAVISVVPKTVTVDPRATLHNDYAASETTDNRRWRNGQRREGGGGAGGRGDINGGEKRNHGRNNGSEHGEASKQNDENTGDPPITGDTAGWKKKTKKGLMVPPSKPRMTKVSDESVMVTWDAPQASGLPILFYKIQYKLVRSRGNRGSRWMTVDEDIPPHINSYEVTGLQTAHTYRFRIAAVYANNDNKLGPNSRRFLLEKDLTIQRPAYPPTIVSVTPQGPTSVKLEWEYKPSPGVPVEGFFINYREATIAGEYTKVTVLGPAKRSFVILHLKANVSYDFKIQCFNIAGASEFSAIYNKNAVGSSLSTTEAPIIINTLVPIFNNDDLSLSNIHLYIILGAVLAFLLLIVIVSATVYTCRNKHTDDDTRSTKYEDTSLHIHRETATYILPHQQNNGQTPNGYLSHQGIAVSPGDGEKVAIESSFIENNNHNTQPVERCYTPSARRIPLEDGSAESEVKIPVLPRNSSDNCESVVRPCSDKDHNQRLCIS